MKIHRNALLLVGFIAAFGCSVPVRAGACACDSDIVSPIGGLVQPDIRDFDLVLRCALGILPPADCTLADVNCDGVVDFRDVGVAMLQFGGADQTACDVPTGACCTQSGCHMEQRDLCLGIAGGVEIAEAVGVFSANGITCDQVNCATGNFVPAASDWGLVMMTLVLLTAGTVMVRQRYAGQTPRS